MQEVKKISSFNDAVSYFSGNIKNLLLNLDDASKVTVQEVRLRAKKPIVIHQKNKALFVSEKSTLETELTSLSYIVSKKEIEESFRKICDYSVYTHQEEISSGFITLKKGHRVGLSGSAAVLGGKIVSFSDISSLNLRISKEFVGCSNKVSSLIEDSGVLIAGEPSSGKTTFLRDLARELSFKKKVVIVDERQEIAGGFTTSWQNDVGFCDVISKVPKELALIYALRSLSPEVLVCDEIGEEREINGIKKVVNSGVLLIASIHAKSLKELFLRESARKLLETLAFKNILFMKGKDFPCEIKDFYKVSGEDAKNFRNDNDNFLHILDGVSSVW